MNKNKDMVIEAGTTYHCPTTTIITLRSEGVLCTSFPIVDWEENEDVL